MPILCRSLSLQNFKICPHLLLQSSVCVYVCIYLIIYIKALISRSEHWNRKQIAVEIPSLVISANSTTISVLKRVNKSPSLFRLDVYVVESFNPM